MGFISKNYYFIKIKLQSEMAGLNSYERKEKYKELQSEVRKRLINTYKESFKKVLFYEDAFTVLAEYECKFLFYNLFFDEDFLNIVNGLIPSNFIKQIQANTNHTFIGYQFTRFLEKRHLHAEVFKREHLFDFLIIELCKSIPDLESEDWSSLEADGGLITNGFIDLLEKHLEEGSLEELQEVFTLLVKIWNYFPCYLSSQKQRIILYSKINQYLNKALINKKNNETKAFDNFLKSSELFLSPLFVDIKYIPLLDKTKSDEYKDGYIKHRCEFFRIYNELKDFNNISVNDSYISLLEIFDRNQKQYIFDTVKDKLERKIKNLDYPTDIEIVEIEKFAGSEESTHLKKTIFEKLYLFEKLF